MKFDKELESTKPIIVTSYAEVWIEMGMWKQENSADMVTSYAEVWIEITAGTPSKPCIFVTSYAEVWIEIMISIHLSLLHYSHLLRGGVD